MQRYCAKRFPPVESIDTLTITDTVNKPVYVEISLPADTLTLTDTVYLPTPEKPLKSFIDTLRNKYAVSLCGWEVDRLVHELQMREATVSDTVYVELINTTQLITIDKIHEVEVTPWYHKWILFLLLGIIVFILVKK
jgi:hypothetical protein